MKGRRTLQVSKWLVYRTTCWSDTAKADEPGGGKVGLQEEGIWYLSRNSEKVVWSSSLAVNWKPLFALFMKHNSWEDEKLMTVGNNAIIVKRKQPRRIYRKMKRSGKRSDPLKIKRLRLMPERLTVHLPSQKNDECTYARAICMRKKIDPRPRNHSSATKK